MKYLLSIIFSLAIVSLYGQVNVHFIVGLGGSSGALAYPYESANTFLGLPEGFLATEFEYELTNKIGLSVFASKKDNTRSYLFGPDARLIRYYIGVKSNFQIFNLGKHSFLEISPNISYGKEKVNWEDHEWSLFSGPGDSITGIDKFNLFQTGLNISVGWNIKNRIILKGTINTNYDFVLSGNRKIQYNSFAPNDAEYQQFKFKGVYSTNLQLSVGFMFFNKTKSDD